MASRKFGIPAIVGILIALGGIVAPMVWEQYRTISAIELQHLATVTLIEKSPVLHKLQVLYDGQPIESVSKMLFALVNTGRKEILEKDLIFPPTITFSEGTQLLDVQTERLSPSNLVFDAKMDCSSQTVSLSFPLLNPSDFIEFSILVAGPIRNYNANARIVGVKELTFVDRVKELKQQHKRIPWTVYPVAAFTFLFVLATFGIIPDVLKERKVKKVFLQTGGIIPEFQTKDEYIQFIKSTLSYIKTSEKRFLINLIEEQETEPLGESQQQGISTAIRTIMTQSSGSLPAMIIIIFFVLLGLWYILSKVL